MSGEGSEHCMALEWITLRKFEKKIVIYFVFIFYFFNCYQNIKF